MELNTPTGLPRCSRNDDAPAVFRPRRIGDPVSELNDAAFDQTRKAALAIQRLDQLGIKVKEVITTTQGPRPATHILVEFCPACRELAGQVKSGGVCCQLMGADVFGCAVQWSQPKEAA